MSTVKNILSMGSMTLLSRILGFGRDVLMASAFGAGMAADAFFIAFKLPNFFRRLFAEGAFSAGFVPLFSKRLKSEDGNQTAEKFASNVLAVFLPTLLIVLAVFEISMPWVMQLLTGGFDDTNQTKFDLVVHLGRLTFPYLLFISLTTLLAGILNGMGRFAAAAFAPVLLNICMIATLLFWSDSPVSTAKNLSIAVSVAGALQFIWLLIAVRRLGFNLSLPRPRLTPGVKQLLKVAAPAAVGAGIMQINLLIDLLIAARFLPEGSISYLFYADRLNQLPVGVIGVAIGTVLLPGISHALKDNNIKKGIEQQNRAIEFGLLLTLPATAALILIPHELISALFERGAFTASDTHAAAIALIAYAFGLPAYILIKALTPAFFARQNTKTPVKIAIFSMILNTALNLVLIIPFAHAGLAMATALSAWVNVGLLFVTLKKQGHFAIDKRLKQRALKIFLSVAIMASTLQIGSDYFSIYFNSRYLSLTVLVLLGILSYFSSAFITGAINSKEFKKFIHRGA